MRDPKRIQRILKMVGEHWEKYPDLRLGQLISNLSPIDVFHVSDDTIELNLIESTKNQSRGN